ncbi:hypothetical protein AGMMS49950_07560 [Endomicrobiia bacterium]|nr:hypothetical protein AGMMS49950_07560 [Endomicrobiia bacterium]
MIKVKFLGKHKRVRNMLVVLAMFVCTNICLGVSDIKEESVSQNDKKTIDQLKKKAEQGNVEAQNKLDLMYDNGKGEEQDYKEAFNWLKKAAEQGDAKAQCYLGWTYLKGKERSKTRL